MMKPTLHFCMLLFAFALAAPATIAQNAFWTEDFSDGGMPAGWSSSDDSGNGGVWTWCDDPVDGIGAGCVFAWATYQGQHGPFSSATADNGFMVMDSDFLGSLSTPPHLVRLTTAPIDCSSLSEVWVASENLIGVWEYATTDNAVLRVSTDGVNWTAYNLFNILPGMQGNEPGVSRWTLNPGYAVTDITAIAAGQSTVYLQWSWAGNYEYYWLLDDVVVYDADPTSLYFPAFDMRVNADWAATAPNHVWPLEMVETFGFLADVENVGLQDQTNVGLNITIEDESGSIVYSEDLDYGSVASGTLVENVPFAAAGFLPTETGVYTGTYTISSDSTDENSGNNSFSFQFLVSDTLFAKEAEAQYSTRPADANWDAGEVWSWAFGNYYYIPEANDNFFKHVFFSLGETADQEGETVTIQIYEWEDTNADTDCNPGERNAVATMFYVITGDETFDNIIAVPVTTLLGDPVPLQDDTEYIVMVEYLSSVVGATVEIGMGDNGYDFGAMVLRSTLDGNPRYADFLGIQGTLDDADYFFGGFTNSAAVPVIRVSIGELSNVREAFELDGDLTLFPNPAKQSVNLDLDFPSTMKDVAVQMYDIHGKLLETRTLENVRQQTVSFNVQHLGPGAYFLRVTTGQGTRTERFNIQR